MGRPRGEPLALGWGTACASEATRLLKAERDREVQRRGAIHAAGGGSSGLRLKPRAERRRVSDACRVDASNCQLGITRIPCWGVKWHHADTLLECAMASRGYLVGV